MAAHKIEVAAKVIGRVKWIGVDKGDRVKEGEVLVRLEDDEYQAQLMQAKGQLTSLEAKLAEAMNGSRPEEVAQAQANVNTAQSDLDNARVTLDRNKHLLKDGVVAKQVVDDAQARYDDALHRVNSLQKTYELVKLGPRKEQIDSLRGQVDQARGAVNYARDQPGQHDHSRTGDGHHSGARGGEGRVRHHRVSWAIAAPRATWFRWPI